ncbi:lysophosphatidic acid acyltransferase LOA1 NDAI_0B05750 [Naumovozyma dairenensis CBS 421]|uniref:Phospholipid/glycerol acyltransferase domain-containing protein n=1 Tax=Naumovozyma dairenensis (strain ATCC 10597 / BCRC 20456 / CBS 421 / NBRC 0211 / NRRL Y-12639) TaxID=1071378 RepID=G0W747_NAUDC|nr:hypothetical protein NDAI_0B05750 [Naumovozyma dairenensis CBS 421]CCD23608.1 hypothetical protein NDAI_0B05750 [Naumovozyma dairenensis CBS 421]
MEKFTNWRDKGTGIAPFLPPTSGNNKDPNVVIQLGYGLILLIKMIIISPLIILFHITGSRTVLKWNLGSLFGWKSDINVVGVKRRLVKPEKHYPMKSQLYVVNYQSSLDCLMLYLISQGSCSFLVPDSDGSIYKMRLFKFICFTLNGSLNVTKYSKEKVQNLGALKNTVNFLFIEGTCSNGKSVLPFGINSSELKSFIDPEWEMNNRHNFDIQNIILKINNSLVTPLPVGKFTFLIRMLTKKVHYKCKITEPQRISATLDELRSSLNDGDKYKLVSKTLGIESKREFVEKYTKTRKV